MCSNTDYLDMHFIYMYIVIYHVHLYIPKIIIIMIGILLTG